MARSIKRPIKDEGAADHSANEWSRRVFSMSYAGEKYYNSDYPSILLAALLINDHSIMGQSQKIKGGKSFHSKFLTPEIRKNGTAATK